MLEIKTGRDMRKSDRRGGNTKCKETHDCGEGAGENIAIAAGSAKRGPVGGTDTRLVGPGGGGGEGV